ncbi:MULTISPECIES: hypothetical protein [Paenibacillus]|uniref:Uncharacterized protein n=1 Tax=Paenibacillus artemisiicola TaxID=1172618 RepID=A0ABS3W773_9BACL|nr:hypothetical protein [Paenibacillus artemisiicola]MBO7744166.1 hypothetical protein [Paenibacillus artemisiicola]
MEGWIKLHRKIRENPIFNDLQLYRLWSICLLEASHKKHQQPVGRQTVSLSPGQFVTGRFDLHGMYNRGLKRSDQVAEYTVWRWLQTLERHGLVSINSSNKFSIVTVVNWSFYQNDEQQNEQSFEQSMSNKRSTNEQLVSTNKNVKNDKNEKNGKKKEIKKYFSEFVSLTEAEYQKLCEAEGEDFTKRCISTLDNYKGASGRVYKSDYRAVLNWVIDRVRQDELKGAKHHEENRMAERRRKDSKNAGEPYRADEDPYADLYN